TLNKDTTITVAADSALSFTGNVSATGRSVTKNGIGTAQFQNIRAASLTINSGTVKIAPSGGTSVVQNLSIAGGATPTAAMDLTNNALVVDYTAASPLAVIAAQIKSGYSGGSWTGDGLTSSSAATNTTAHITALGYAEASAILGVGGGSFAGQSVDGSSVLIAYTYAGDSNLDGTVDLTDFTDLAANFNKQTGAQWLDGDYNYDGAVDLTDFTFLASNFNQTIAPGTIGAVIPEPSSIALLAAMALVGHPLQRRRRRV